MLNVSFSSLKYSICGCGGWSWLSRRLVLKLTKRFLLNEVRKPILNVIALSGVTHIIGGSRENSESCLLSFPLPSHHADKFIYPVCVLLRGHLPYCYDDCCHPLCYWNSMSATLKGRPKTSDYPGILQDINKWTGSAKASILLMNSYQVLHLSSVSHWGTALTASVSQPNKPSFKVSTLSVCSSREPQVRSSCSMVHFLTSSVHSIWILVALTP